MSFNASIISSSVVCGCGAGVAGVFADFWTELLFAGCCYCCLACALVSPDSEKVGVIIEGLAYVFQCHHCL